MWPDARPAAGSPSRYRFLVLALIMGVQTAANVGALNPRYNAAPMTSQPDGATYEQGFSKYGSYQPWRQLVLPNIGRVYATVS